MNILLYGSRGCAHAASAGIDQTRARQTNAGSKDNGEWTSVCLHRGEWEDGDAAVSERLGEERGRGELSTLPQQPRQSERLSEIEREREKERESEAALLGVVEASLDLAQLAQAGAAMAVRERERQEDSLGARTG